MPRYFFKIVVLPILDNNVVAGQCARDHVLDGLCASISAIKETTFVTPGISTYASELNLGGDNIVNADFWIIKDISKIDLQDILKGTDGAMILVDTTIDPDASTTIEYLGIIEREFRFLPSMIVAIDSSSPLTARDHGFAAKLWESRVVECTSVNQSALGMFVHVVTTLLTGIVNHQEVGPVFYEHDWLRTKVVWETMNAIIDQDKVSPQQMVYMGRNFNLLSLISSKKGKHDSHVLGSIAASWFEMAGEFMLGFHVTERLGLARRTLELKRKYLGSLVAEAKRLYNTSKFEEAALKYQEAAYWNKVEFIDRAGMETLFMNAIDAWVSIFGFDKVQGLLDQLQSPATFLSELKEKVYRGINFLVERNLLDKANFQLDAITRTFMKHDLHDTASELAKRHVDIKLALLGEKIKERFIGDALLLLDELATLQQHVATTINIPDACLATLCAFLLEDLNYSEYEKVAALVKDPAIAKQLEARRVVREAEIAEDEKHKKDSAKKNLYQRLLAYVEAERDDALEYAKSRRKIVHDMIDQGKSDQAYHFLKVTAQWLLDLEKPGISGDLVYYLVTIFVKNRFDVDLKDISTFIPKEKMEELVNHIQDYICGTGPKEMDLYFSDFVDHYMQQARSNNYYSQANMLRDKLEHTLLHEIEVLSTTLDGDTVDIMTSKIDKFLGVVAHSDIKHDYRARLDDIYGKLVDHYILKRDAIQADSYINHISTIEGKKACNAKLATLVAELDSERPDEYKARDEVRQLEEGLEDVLNALVREQSVVLTKRHERERRLKELQASGVIPQKLAFTITNEHELLRDIDILSQNQLRATTALFTTTETVDVEDMALSIASSVLLAIKRNDIDSINDILFSIPGNTVLVKQQVIEHPGYKLVSLLYKAITFESGEQVAEALSAMELVPLINGERMLAFSILNKPIPKHVTTRIQLGAAEDEFTKMARDVLPYLVEAALDMFSELGDTIRVKRELLLKDGKIEGPRAITKNSIQEIAMFYQDDGLRAFKESDVELGWLSMWLSILTMVKSDAPSRDILALFKSVLKTTRSEETLAKQPMAKLIELFLKCVERGNNELLGEIKAFQRNLPLLDEEKTFFDVDALL